jgi:2-methylcitrate dehydratase PrpD
MGLLIGRSRLTLSTAEFHSQTAIEAAEIVNKKLAELGKTAADIKEITNRTHEACIRIIDKQFKAMDNFADRDHCVQVGCVHGKEKGWPGDI